MLREGFTTPDNVQKKDLFFYHVTRSAFRISREELYSDVVDSTKRNYSISSGLLILV